ncbi:MAG: peptidoglycan-binding protein [Bacteroidales bacterium]|nr:peptidoglycan-binding protein [Bacteroidales bacterium]
MKKLSKKIIQSLMVSAAFSLLGTNAQAKDVSATASTKSADGNIDEQHNILKTNIFHNVLKISSSGKLYGVDSHRSHSSHSSHRSSRYSSGSRGGSVSNFVANESNSLGNRSLTVGDSGNDVYELVKLLEKAGCPPNPKLLEDKGRKYTTDVAMAVKVFQAFAGLSVTGIADIDTINKLKSSAK